MIEQQEGVQLADAPAIPGLRFRYYAGPDDIPQIYALHDVAQIADQFDRESTHEGIITLAEVEAVYSNVQADDSNRLFAEVEGQIIGCVIARVWWTEIDGTRLYLPLLWVHPDWRGQGIEQALLHWAEDRFRSLEAEQPADGKGMFGANASSTQPVWNAVLQQSGYELTFSLADMKLNDLSNLPDAVMPAGINLQPIRPEDHRAVWDEIETVWALINPQHEIKTEEQYQEWLAEPNYDADLSLIAWDGDQIAGLCLCQAGQGRVAVNEINVGAAWRRRGIAKALLMACLKLANKQGLASAWLHTHADNRNGARSLYESIGFHQVKEHLKYRRPMLPSC